MAAFSSMVGLHGAAFLLARAGFEDEAAVAYEQAGAPASWTLPPFAVASGLASGSFAARALGRREHYNQLVARFEEVRGEHAVNAGLADYLAPVELHLGSLALILGRADAAIGVLTEAVEKTQRGGAVGFLAEARLRLAEATSSRSSASRRGPRSRCGRREHRDEVRDE